MSVVSFLVEITEKDDDELRGLIICTLTLRFQHSNYVLTNFDRTSF